MIDWTTQDPEPHADQLLGPVDLTKPWAAIDQQHARAYYRAVGFTNSAPSSSPPGEAYVAPPGRAAFATKLKAVILRRWREARVPT